MSDLQSRHLFTITMKLALSNLAPRLAPGDHLISPPEAHFVRKVLYFQWSGDRI